MLKVGRTIFPFRLDLRLHYSIKAKIIIALSRWCWKCEKDQQFRIPWDTCDWIQHVGLQTSRWVYADSLDFSDERKLNEHMGDIQFRLKNTDEAVKYWNKAKSLGGESGTRWKNQESCAKGWVLRVFHWINTLVLLDAIFVSSLFIILQEKEAK